MSHKLTKRQLQTLKKQFENKERREESKEAKRRRQQERSLRPRRPPRRRDWADADGAPGFEKMRAADTLAAAAPPVASESAAPGLVATVIEVRSGDSLVSCDGRLVRAVLPPAARVSGGGLRSPVAVGDRVGIEPVEAGLARITAVLPRRSALVREVYDPSRRDPVSRGQVLAANIDQVVIVCSPAEPPFRPRLLDRYLVAASRDGLAAVICLNKTDLGVPDEVEYLLDRYERLGVGTVHASAARGEVDALRSRIAGTVSLFTGHSGVGKSSLLNALEPGLALKVGTVTPSAAGQGKGRHTTASARLVPVSLRETFVVDSPGIRAFGIKGLDLRELASHFADIASIAACAYRDCLHRGEAGCAVDVQAQDDRFLKLRLESYRTLLREL